ncbi:hypothetical protein Lal_00039572 [Lupinus albus]|nr:hypothetical protein Lal_00039572 [Lupinus albus]
MGLINPFGGDGASINRPPIFGGEGYAYWKVRMRIFIEAINTYIFCTSSADIAANSRISSQASNDSKASLLLKIIFPLSSLLVNPNKCVWGPLFNVTAPGSRLSEPILAQASPFSLKRAHSRSSEPILAQASPFSLKRAHSRSSENLIVAIFAQRIDVIDYMDYVIDYIM